jgi:hypothetical protein
MTFTADVPVANRQPNRGPHTADADLFASEVWPALQLATDHLSWLLSQGYAPASSLKLVGDRFALVTRQRIAVSRSACSDHALHARADRAIPQEALGDLEIDALNLLITIEAALAGGVLLLGRDGCLRDMASIHGSYRQVNQTQAAIELIGSFLTRHRVGKVLWRIDRPVSNSGRLKKILLAHAAQQDLDWDVVLDDDPDRVLGQVYPTVVTADSAVLDRVQSWVNLASWIVAECVSPAWIVPMSIIVATGEVTAPIDGNQQPQHHGDAT